jgi:hypothetical protein
MLGIHKKIENRNHERYRAPKNKTIRRNEKRRSRALIDRLAVEADFHIRDALVARRDPRVNQ